MSLFKPGKFKSHAGLELDWKIDCDALQGSDLETLAKVVSEHFSWKYVYGVPTGGVAFAEALSIYDNPSANFILIVDDVLTTGTSMWEAYDKFPNERKRGIVIFSRAEECPAWIYPIFSLSYPFSVVR